MLPMRNLLDLEYTRHSVKESKGVQQNKTRPVYIVEQAVSPDVKFWPKQNLPPRSPIKLKPKMKMWERQACDYDANLDMFPYSGPPCFNIKQQYVKEKK